jgi:6-hydroxynicotinate reductase
MTTCARARADARSRCRLGRAVQENCEPALCSVVFIGGAGGSLRAGVTENPVKLTRSVRETLTHVTSGGAEVYIWPGGGITYMVDVLQMPENSFGYVPTPALVAPIEFTMRLSDYEALGGHMGSVRRLEEVTGADRQLSRGTEPGRWPVQPHRFGWGRGT